MNGSDPLGEEPRPRAARRRNPARALVLGLLGAVALGTLLLRLPVAHAPGHALDGLAALFTATSALCVTGLVVVDTGTALSPFGQAVVLLLIKTGGLGVLSLGALIALATGRRMGFGERQRLQAQVGAQRVGGVVRFVRALLAYTTTVEIVGALALWPRLARDEGLWSGAWSALFHAVSAFNNAGFSLYRDSLRAFADDPWIAGVTLTLLALGGIGLVVVVDVAARAGLGTAGDGRRRHLTLHTRLALSATLALALAGTAALAALEWRNPDGLGAIAPRDRPLAALFQALTPRTAGFEVVDVGAYRTPSQLVTMALMLVGGNPGSTAGGIKTTTLAVLLLAALALARGRERVTAFGRTLANETITKAAVIATLALLAIGMAATALTLTEPTLPPLTLAFEAVSAFGTVGLSLGATAELSAAGRVIVIVTMLAGRLGLLTVALALAADATRPAARFPNEDVIVG
ncbi:MAG: TrkH family potassium uptake protein [Nocardiopsis sp. BM-2018]|nr:MAG: TrkH family potassium uptake protein [Nocardiopsis sp. BM-2018]